MVWIFPLVVITENFHIFPSHMLLNYLIQEAGTFFLSILFLYLIQNVIFQSLCMQIILNDTSNWVLSFISTENFYL